MTITTRPAQNIAAITQTLRGDYLTAYTYLDNSKAKILRVTIPEVPAVSGQAAIPPFSFTVWQGSAYDTNAANWTQQTLDAAVAAYIQSIQAGS